AGPATQATTATLRRFSSRATGMIARAPPASWPTIRTRCGAVMRALAVSWSPPIDRDDLGALIPRIVEAAGLEMLDPKSRRREISKVVVPPHVLVHVARPGSRVSGVHVAEVHGVGDDQPPDPPHRIEIRLELLRREDAEGRGREDHVGREGAVLQQVESIALDETQVGHSMLPGSVFDGQVAAHELHGGVERGQMGDDVAVPGSDLEDELGPIALDGGGD